ncbi:hypothetical protein M885DRAFT_549630 [Pelagophyceae sp. CCMP2097]|nr:hypothetical protein M885DRAFT_549630 [Pelagophyceae sp. CCMP2097]
MAARPLALVLLVGCALALGPKPAAQMGAKSQRADTLTADELALRFVDVKRHFSDTAAETEATVASRLMRLRVADLELDRCYVAASAVHGRGLFASRDIGRGELITLYPGDAELLWDDASSRRAGGALKAQFGAHVSVEEQASATFFLRLPAARDYEIPGAAQSSLVADPDRDGDAAYLAHFANDAACLARGTDAARTAYSKTSVTAANAALLPIEGCHYGIAAIAAIAKDAEVFLSYGECARPSLASSGRLGALFRVEGALHRPRRSSMGHPEPAARPLPPSDPRPHATPQAKATGSRAPAPRRRSALLRAARVLRTDSCGARLALRNDRDRGAATAWTADAAAPSPRPAAGRKGRAPKRGFGA